MTTIDSPELDAHDVPELDIDRLKVHTKVLVTGCQRSGTTIISKMIALDIGYRHMDEHEFKVHDVDKFRALIMKPEPMVIHCPGMTNILHHIDSEKVIIVWVRRPYKEIRASMNRINWPAMCEAGEKNRYAVLSKEHSLDLTLPIEVIKNTAWSKVQSSMLSSRGIPVLNMNYHSSYVKNHSLYLPDHSRKSFSPKQTSIRFFR